MRKDEAEVGMLVFFNGAEGEIEGISERFVVVAFDPPYLGKDASLTCTLESLAERQATTQDQPTVILEAEAIQEEVIETPVISLAVQTVVAKQPPRPRQQPPITINERANLNPRMVAGAQRRWESERKKGVLYAIRGIAYGMRAHPVSDEIMQERVEKAIVQWLEREPEGTLRALLGVADQPFSPNELVAVGMLLCILESDPDFIPVTKDRMTWRLRGESDD